jgi:threonine/homoserine/homoserine lactone efflux protein
LVLGVFDAVMEPGVIFGFAIACVVLNLVPGPGMMFIIAHGIAGGRRAGVIAATGMASGSHGAYGCSRAGVECTASCGALRA